MPATAMLVCARCGSRVTRTRRFMPGSILIEAFLWLLFLLPGLIYSIWRHTASYQGCPLCQGRELIPADSPRGRQIAADSKGLSVAVQDGQSPAR